MALDEIHLRKILKIIFSDERKRRSELRKDIREELAREAGRESSGGDFYGPFWADAKSHVFGASDLRDSVDGRLEANKRRNNLYPLLRDGFLIWWDERRRWTNEPFLQGTPLKTQFSFPGLNSIVKIENILSVRDGLGVEHFIYPYFSNEPAISEKAARLGLWLLLAALPNIPPEEIRILDVIRGRTFSIDRNPLLGNEEREFRELYAATLHERATLRRKEY